MQICGAYFPRPGFHIFGTRSLVWIAQILIIATKIRLPFRRPVTMVVRVLGTCIASVLYWGTPLALKESLFSLTRPIQVADSTLFLSVVAYSVEEQQLSCNDPVT